MRSAFVADALDKLAPSGQVRRVAARFGLVAVGGELATLAGVTGWPAGAAREAALTCFKAWLADRGGAGSAEQKALLEQVRHFFAMHGESRFTPWDRSPEPTADDRTPRTSNRAGFVRKVYEADGEPGLKWYVFPEVFRAEIAAGFDPTEAAGVLAQRGWLLRDPEDRLTHKPRLPGFASTSRVYVFSDRWGA
jgi:uncharacterized protein (DUF927 family)